MPDTLPLPWTWDSIPGWERAVLEGIQDEIKKIRHLKVDLMEPDPTPNQDWWYGLRVWRSTWLGGYRVCSVYVAGHVLSILSRLEELRFDLYEPDSLDRALAAIRRLAE